MKIFDQLFDRGFDVARAILDRIGLGPLIGPVPAFAQPCEPPVTGFGGLVVAYHPRARAVGEAILAAGGNAFDAFVATVAAENVMSEGASSLAGPLGVLIYRAADGATVYLDAEFNDPLDPAAVWTADAPVPGKAVLVPGAPSGLEALARSYGRIPFATLLAPAIAIAEEGFPATRLMEVYVKHRADILKTTEYGRETYFPGGEPLRAGQILKLPAMATFLRGLAAQGSAYVLAGDFAQEFLQTVRDAGGGLTEVDLATYQVRSCAPWTTTYRGRTLISCSGRGYGGLWALLALKILEHTTLPPTPHYGEDADLLALMIRITQQVWSERFIFSDQIETDRALVQACLTPDYAMPIFNRAMTGTAAKPLRGEGTHSFQIITTDAEGNIASGITTMESDPWGDGLFVQGQPLTTAGRVPWTTGPGRRRMSPFSIHLVMENGQPQLSVGTISNSVAEAAFQLLVNLIDYGMTLPEAVTARRFGTFPPTRQGALELPQLSKSWLDPRVERPLVRQLRRNGIKVEQRGLVDTGLGAVLKLNPDGTREGVTVPIPYLPDAFGDSPDDVPPPDLPQNPDNHEPPDEARTPNR